MNLTSKLIVIRRDPVVHTLAKRCENALFVLRFVSAPASQWSQLLQIEAMTRGLCGRQMPREFAIQVGTPRRGSTQLINTIYTAKSAMNPNQPGINFISSSMVSNPAVRHMIDTIKAFDHSFILRIPCVDS